ncbi:MAG: class I SAM-dependent methyltransferase [Rhizobiales bacterium]|nr:class I SAM-dependent methyltransferase [Hyphomicrobiales bacterium]
MIENPSPHDGLGLFVRLRLWVSELIYSFTFVTLTRDGSWRNELFVALAPKSGDRVLSLGKSGLSSVISLERLYPEVHFTGVDQSPKAVKEISWPLSDKKPGNAIVTNAPLRGSLPFEASSFDIVICMLALHEVLPDDKLGFVSELARLLRHGGTLHMAEFDSPENPGEGRILAFASRIFGPDAIAPHRDGSWMKVLVKGGFTTVKLQSSHSVGIGRISFLKARKR